MNEKDLITLNDRLADVLVVTKGFKLGVLANPNGNNKQREALLELIEYIEGNLNTSKGLVRKAIS